MPETVIIENTGASDLTLPCGTRIPARRSVPVLVKALIAQRDNPVVRHWFGDGKTGTLRPAAPLPGIGGSDGGCDCADVQSRLAEWVETARRHAAERDAAGDELAGLHVEAVAARDEIARLTSELAAAHAAKADADALVALAQDELTKATTDKPSGEAAKTKGGKAT